MAGYYFLARGKVYGPRDDAAVAMRSARHIANYHRAVTGPDGAIQRTERTGGKVTMGRVINAVKRGVLVVIERRVPGTRTLEARRVWEVARVLKANREGLATNFVLHEKFREGDGLDDRFPLGRANRGNSKGFLGIHTGSHGAGGVRGCGGGGGWDGV